MQLRHHQGADGAQPDDHHVARDGAGSAQCGVLIDLLTGPTLREKLTGAINAVPAHLVIDLSAVQFLASIGLNVLVEILAAQEAAGRHLALVVNDNHAVTHSLQATGLDQVFDLHAEIATAIEGCTVPMGAPRPARATTGRLQH
ncbi:MAG: hypothetical protein DLM60_00250 [Pseudonocardiales bacterium]|nr:MAG: hypothetical protein DLM60_00250 [Pseudonocardiales bacterium]